MTGDLMERFNQIFDKNTVVSTPAPNIVEPTTEAQAAAFAQSLGYTIPVIGANTDPVAQPTGATNTGTGTEPVVTEIDPPALPLIPKVPVIDPPALPIDPTVK